MGTQFVESFFFYVFSLCGYRFRFVRWVSTKCNWHAHSTDLMPFGFLCKNIGSQILGKTNSQYLERRKWTVNKNWQKWCWVKGACRVLINGVSMISTIKHYVQPRDLLWLYRWSDIALVANVGRPPFPFLFTLPDLKSTKTYWKEWVTCMKAKNITEDAIIMRFRSTHSSPACTQPFSFIVFDMSF